MLSIPFELKNLQLWNKTNQNNIQEIKLCTSRDSLPHTIPIRTTYTIEWGSWWWRTHSKSFKPHCALTVSTVSRVSAEDPDAFKLDVELIAAHALHQILRHIRGVLKTKSSPRKLLCSSGNLDVYNLLRCAKCITYRTQVWPEKCQAIAEPMSFGLFRTWGKKGNKGKQGLMEAIELREVPVPRTLESWQKQSSSWKYPRWIHVEFIQCTSLDTASPAKGADIPDNFVE